MRTESTMASHFNYTCSNGLDSLLRRALHDDDIDDLPVKSSGPVPDYYDRRSSNVDENSNLKPELDSDNAKGSVLDSISRYTVPKNPCTLVTTARVEAMLQRLNDPNDDDLDLSDDIKPSPLRRTRSLVERLKRKVTKTIKRTTSMTNMKL